MTDYREFLKAEERVQLILGYKASAARQIILSYNDINLINRPGLTEEKVLNGCIRQLQSAMSDLEKALVLYRSEGMLPAKMYINTRLEQLRNNTRFLPSIHTSQDTAPLEPEKAELADNCELSFNQKTDLGMHVIKIRRQLVRFLMDLQYIQDSHAESCSFDKVKSLSSSVRAILNSLDDIDFTSVGVQ